MQKNWESIRYKVENDEDDDYYNEGSERFSGMAWELLKKVKEVFKEEMGIEFEFEWVDLHFLVTRLICKKPDVTVACDGQLYVYVYVYTYMCGYVCVCVCWGREGERDGW